MEINLKYFRIYIEYIFLIVLFVCILSPKIAKILSNFYLCYLFILFHELSHVFVASILRKDIDKLNITLSGVSVSFKIKRYEIGNITTKLELLKDIAVYLAGPISNLLLAFLFFKIELVFEINIFLAFLNFLPIYPLDGYNIVNRLFRVFGINKVKASIITDNISNFFIFAFILCSIFIFVYLKNFSFIIFSFYLLVLKYINKKTLNF